MLESSSLTIIQKIQIGLYLIKYLCYRTRQPTKFIMNYISFLQCIEINICNYLILLLFNKKKNIYKCHFIFWDLSGI